MFRLIMAVPFTCLHTDCCFHTEGRLKRHPLCWRIPIVNSNSCVKGLQNYKKVQCTLVQALRLCTGRKAHRGSRGIALPFYDHGTRRGWWVWVTPRPLFTPGKGPVSIVQEAGWAPGPVWTGAENLSLTGIRSPDRPARSSVTILTELPGPLIEL